MNSRALAAVAVIVGLIAVAFVGFPPANAAPPQPHNFFGIARDSSSVALPFGTRITAWVDGVDYSNGTSVVNPPGSYDMDVFGDNQTDIATDNTPTVKTGGDISDEIMYVAGDMTTYKALNPQQVFTAKDFWGVPTTGQSENLDLTLALPGSQPGLPKIGRITTQPADGLTQYLYLCNPTASAIDASQYYLEKPVPGAFNGPTHAISGIIGPLGGRLYVNLTSWSAPTTLVTTGDGLKLVWNNPGGGAFGGTDIIVDRVEYNGTFSATFVEPVNTIMSDAVAPGFGQEIRRIGADTCQDTNSNSVDFGLTAETGRPAAGNTVPTVVVSTPSGGEDWTGNTVHTVFWNQSDAEDAFLTAALDAGTDGITWPYIIFGGSRPNGANSFAWPVPCLNSTTVRVRGQVFDTGGASALSITNTFTIDCTAPTLDTVIPPNGQTGVDVNTDVTLTFSEPMNQGATEGAISFLPAVVPLAMTWPTLQTVVVNPTPPLLGNTLYTVTVSCAAKDDSDTGNLLAACPRTSTFTTTTADPAPTVDLTDPDGGEVWTGGSVHNILWTMSDNTPGTLSTTLEYSTNGGGSWTAIFTNQARAQGPNSFAWTVPCPSTTTARVRVTASDAVPQSSSDMSAANFAIDCSVPTVISTSPGNNAPDVGIGDPIIILFSEPMEQATVTATFTVGPAVSGIAFFWDAADTLRVTHNDFATCTRYTATVAATAEDLSDPGNAMGTPFTWSFDTACGPTIVITAPTSADAFSCASSQTLWFNVTDTDANVFVWINWTFPVLPPISQSSRATGIQEVPFVVPFANTTAAQITVTAQDSTNLNGVDTAVFAIDCTAPSVVSSVPADAAANVALTGAFTITFTEDMDPTSACNAISLNPPAWTGSPQCTWTTARVVQVAHAKLRTGQAYTLTVTTTARDASDPGINLSPVYTADFTTTLSSGLDAIIAGPSTGQTGTQYTYDGSGSTPSADITTYEWEFVNPSEVSSFPTPGNTAAFTFNTAGTWRVILNVTDAAGNYDTAELTVVISSGGGSNFLADYWWLFVILILAIVGALIFLLAKRRKKEEEPMPPEVPPEQVETMPPSRAPSRGPPSPAMSAPTIAPPGKPTTRECPVCGTIVDVVDTECFMCGSKL